MNSTPQLYRARIRIRFGHTDPAGIVFFPRYFEMLQAAVEDWFLEGLGVDYADYVLNGDHGLPTVKTECEFMRPSRLGELLELEVHIARLGNSSLELEYLGYCGDELRIQARSVLVQIRLSTNRPLPFEGEIRRLLEAYQSVSRPRQSADD